MFSRVGGNSYNSGFITATQNRQKQSQNQSQNQSSRNNFEKSENIFAKRSENLKQPSFGETKNNNSWWNRNVNSDIDDSKKLANLEKKFKDDKNYQNYLKEHASYNKSDSLRKFSAIQRFNSIFDAPTERMKYYA